MQLRVPSKWNETSKARQLTIVREDPKDIVATLPTLGGQVYTPILREKKYSMMMLEIETVSMHDYINIWDDCGINTTHGEEISRPRIDANFGIKNSRE